MGVRAAVPGECIPLSLPIPYACVFLHPGPHPPHAGKVDIEDRSRSLSRARPLVFYSLADTSVRCHGNSAQKRFEISDHRFKQTSVLLAQPVNKLDLDGITQFR